MRSLTAMAALVLLMLAADGIGYWPRVWAALTGHPVELLPPHAPLWMWSASVGFILTVFFIRLYRGGKIGKDIFNKHNTHGS